MTRRRKRDSEEGLLPITYHIHTEGSPVVFGNVDTGAHPPVPTEGEPLALLTAALQARQFLLVWVDVPFPPQERPPRNPAREINCWQEATRSLPGLPFDFTHGKPWPLEQLPPLTILSLDPTDRIETAFRHASVPLGVVRTRRDVPLRDQHSLLKLGGDLSARSGLFLSWEDVHAASGDPDKAHLLQEAGRLARDGAVLVLVPSPTDVFIRMWRELVAPTVREAGHHFALGPSDFPWPAPLMRLRAEPDEILTMLADTVIPLPLEPAPRSREINVPEQFTNGYALLIGVDENQVTKLALPDVAKDITALTNVLTHPEQCAYPESNVRTITGQSATRQTILDGLKWLRKRIQADTSGNATGIVYYTGHGWRDTTVEPSAFYLIPYNVGAGAIRSRALRAADFAKAVGTLEPRRLLVVLDCCHAGGMGAKDVPFLPAGYVEAAIPPSLLMEGEQASAGPGTKGIETLAQGQGRAVLSSSTGEQSSYVRRDGTMSIFTYHLIEALTGHAQPEEGATEVLVSDVMSHVWRHVPRSARADWNAKQEPDYLVSGNFPIALLLGGKGLPREPSTEIATPTRMRSGQKAELARALLACHTMSDRHIRDTVVNDLRSDIKDNIRRSPVDRVDVMNIVTRCLDYPNGIKELIEIVRFYEGNSIGMRQVDDVIG